MRLVMTKQEATLLREILDKVLEDPEMIPFYETKDKQGCEIYLQEKAAIELLKTGSSKLSSPLGMVIRKKTSQAVQKVSDYIALRI